MADAPAPPSKVVSEEPPPKAWEKAIGMRVELPGIGSGKASREYREEIMAQEAVTSKTNTISAEVKIVSSK